ncbi:MAG: RNA polymerase sigma factor [Chitinophagales bacterium]
MLNHHAEFTKLTDNELLSTYSATNDDKCIATLYSRYYQKVYHKCLTFTKDKDKAFDLTQDILVKTLRNVSSFQSKSAFSSWLYRITYNYCIDYVRNKKKRAEISLETQIHIAEQMPYEEYKEDDYQRFKRVQKLLSRFTGETREMLELKYLEGYSLKEIMDKYGLAESAVKMRLLRAKRKIADLYDKEFIQ